MSVLQLYTEPPLTPTKLSTCVAKVQCSIHLEPLVSTLSSFQYSLQNHSSQHSQTLRTRHVAIEGNFKLDSNDDGNVSLVKIKFLTAVLLRWSGAQQKYVVWYIESLS